MEKQEILVIGAGPAGIVSAVTARKYYPDKKITIIKNVKNGCIPCGIPYMFSSLEKPEDNSLKTTGLKPRGIETVFDEVSSIDAGGKVARTRGGGEYSYEKLVLAVGSEPIIPPIQGVDKKGVYPIHKDMDYLLEAVKKIKGKKEILVIGGGFIGVEFADEISRINGMGVTLVEMLPHILFNSFDEELSVLAEERLKRKGVNIITGVSVKELLGEKEVEQALLSDGRKINCESVILGIGARPSVKLARETGLEIGKCGGVLVDEYMRTSNRDIFAVGDCSCKREFFTRKAIPVMLASTATAEARIAGANLYSIKVVRENKGTIAIYSTYVDGLVLSSAGLTERSAREEGFEINVGVVKGFDKHPSTLPGVHKSMLKLVFSKQSGIILGGQVSCGMACAQLINLIGVAIQKRMSATELETLQMATHPYLTSSPTQYPVVLAAQEVQKRGLGG